MSARDQILQRLRNRTGDRLPTPERDFTAMARPEWSTEDKLARFRSAMAPVHGEIHDCRGDNWVTVLAGLLADRQVARMLVGSGAEPLTTLRSSKQELPDILVYDEPVESWQEHLFHNVDAGLTTTRGGIAETGSLILWPTAEEPRLTSLVPPIHVALLKASELFGTLREAMAVQHWHQGMPTNALLVSSPSKTADIEQTLAYGVHGPRELIVLVTE
ncbi:lactate utilization protein C [Marinobacter lacisalsi]|uniref:Lactate utilization protein C n=1 Tax=Marinobacter lacisalsi TaxID=475979 RepID=A0ABV8QLQ1_9GAMM